MRCELVVVVALGLGACLSKPEPFTRDASSGDATDATDAALCTAFTSWSLPILVPGLNSSNDDDEWPALSPDGTLLVFASRRGGGSQDLYVGRFDGIAITDVQPIGVLNTVMEEAGAAWSFDGSQLFFSRGTGYLASNIVSGDPPFGAPQPATILQQLGIMTHPRFSSDGLEVFYVKDGAMSTSEVFRSRRSVTTAAFPPGGVIAEISVPTKVTFGAGISGDGATLYFNSDRGAAGGSYEVFTATRPQPSAIFGAPEVIQNIGTSQLQPEISRDQRVLLFARDESSGRDISVSRRDCL